MRYHANREGDAARRHAIDAYRRHGLSVQGHDRERPLDRAGVALDYHYEEGLVEAGAPRAQAADLVEALLRCRRNRWTAERVCRATTTAATIPAALALLALLAGATPALARGPVDSQAKGATCTPSARVICADAAGGPPGPKAAPPPGTYHLERTGADHGGAGADTRAFDRLEAEGLGERKTHPQDKRVVFIVPTPLGEKVARDMMGVQYAPRPTEDEGPAGANRPLRAESYSASRSPARPGLPSWARWR